MPVVDGRQYRSIEMSNFETRDDYIVEGYATTFGEPYEMGAGYFEVIDPHALDGADTSDVIFQYDHAGLVMARTKNGSLAVMPDSHGYHVRASLGGTRAGRELYEAISNGLVDKMSWAFKVAEDGWEYDRDSRTSTVKRVDKVYDVSAVSVPANGGTEISARSYLDGVIEAERRESSLRQSEQDERMRLALLLSLERG